MPSDALPGIRGQAPRPQPSLREVGRRTVATASAQGPVQMIDLVQVGAARSSKPARPPPAFLVNGQALFVVEDEVTPSVETADDDDDAMTDGDYVWDVYAMTNASPVGTDLDGGTGPAFAQLAAPIFGDDFEDLEDIDDSQSDDSGPPAERKWGGGDSSDEDCEYAPFSIEKARVAGMLEVLD